VAHDRHDLIDGWWVSGIADALVARRMPGVIAGQRRRRTAPARRVEHGHGGHRTSSDRTADTTLPYTTTNRPRYRLAWQIERLLELGSPHRGARASSLASVSHSWMPTPASLANDMGRRQVPTARGSVVDDGTGDLFQSAR
jgi:hypothetical protein